MKKDLSIERTALRMISLSDFSDNSKDQVIYIHRYPCEDSKTYLGPF